MGIEGEGGYRGPENRPEWAPEVHEVAEVLKDDIPRFSPDTAAALQQQGRKIISVPRLSFARLEELTDISIGVLTRGLHPHGVKTLRTRLSRETSNAREVAIDPQQPALPDTRNEPWDTQWKKVIAANKKLRSKLPGAKFVIPGLIDMLAIDYELTSVTGKPWQSTDTTSILRSSSVSPASLLNTLEGTLTVALRRARGTGRGNVFEGTTSYLMSEPLNGGGTFYPILTVPNVIVPSHSETLVRPNR